MIVHYGLVSFVLFVSFFVLTVFSWIKTCIRRQADNHIIFLGLIFSMTVFMRMFTETFVFSEAVLHFVFVLFVLVQCSFRIAEQMNYKSGKNSVNSTH